MKFKLKMPKLTNHEKLAIGAAAAVVGAGVLYYWMSKPVAGTAMTTSVEQARITPSTPGGAGTSTVVTAAESQAAARAQWDQALTPKPGTFTEYTTPGAKAESAGARTATVQSAWTGSSATKPGTGVTVAPTVSTTGTVVPRAPGGSARFQGIDIGEAPATRGNYFGDFEIATKQPRGAR